jgi:hypothetical protein
MMVFRRALSLLRGVGRTAHDERLTVTACGIELHDRRRSRLLWSVGWNELDEIVAFKRDMLAVDDVCLGFRVRGESRFRVCDEEIAGWDDVNEALATRSGIRYDEWFARIVQPPFAANSTVLWRRDPTAE